MAKILFVSEYGRHFGGIERYMTQFADLLRRNGDTVTLATPDGVFDPSFAERFDDTVQINEALKRQFDHAIVHRLREAKSLEKVFNTFDSTLLVHDHELYCPRRSYYLPFSRKNCHRGYSKLICSACAMCRRPKSWQDIKETLWDFPATYRTSMSAPHFVVISKFMRQCLIDHGVHHQKISLINTFVQNHPSPTFNPAPKKLLFLGQLIRGKGVDLLLESLSLVKNECVLTVAGTGNDEALLQKISSKIPHKVIFSGFVSNPEKTIQDADIVILPHRWQEPFGLVGLEAASWGKPIIGFALGGVLDYLESGKSGLAVPPGDITKLAEEIDHLLTDPHLGYSLGLAAQLIAQENYSEPSFVENWQSLWRNK